MVLESWRFNLYLAQQYNFKSFNHLSTSKRTGVIKATFYNAHRICWWYTHSAENCIHVTIQPSIITSVFVKKKNPFFHEPAAHVLTTISINITISIKNFKKSDKKLNELNQIDLFSPV